MNAVCSNIKCENAGGIFIGTAHEPRFRDAGINNEYHEVILMGTVR